jgi:hypothetical protein
MTLKLHARYVVVGFTLLRSEALPWVSLHLFVVSVTQAPFSLTPSSVMSFSFKLDGCPASAEVSSGSQSYLSPACLNRSGLSFSEGWVNVAVPSFTGFATVHSHGFPTPMGFFSLIAR